ncbi:MAG: hypothetical protein ACPGES_00390 [Coraliomargarita sp.]
MNVLLLTVFLSLLLAVLFLIFFLGDRKNQHFSSPEQDALRPFENETPRVQKARGGKTEVGTTPTKHTAHT